ncbi:MAG: hypothetical protein QOK05_305 [Chloroflexota bacterium]|jgi:nitrite reductase/ring-hydroxylating ferredoxin subunit|nr:hypothetical protein [Chloroflexota bacterium]
MVNVDAGAAADFEQGVPRMITIAGQEVGVIRWGERYYAVRNHCPDQGGPLCAGPVRLPLAAELAGEHMELSLAEGHPVIACPWHHYEFDLETGRELRGGRRALTYRVELAGGRVLVGTGRDSS